MAGNDEFLKGLGELLAELKQIAATVQNNALCTGVFRAAQMMRDKAKANAPVSSGDPPKGGRFAKYTPGTLRDSLKAKRRRGSRTEVAAGVTGAFYAKWVEFGHTLVGHKPDKKVLGHVPANPFLRRTFEENQKDAVDVMKQGIVEAIRKRVDKLKGGKA